VKQQSAKHVDNNPAVRKILKERGVKPEQLPPAEDIKKVKRKLESEEKNAVRKLKKGK
jgi:DNA-damage-inducible protein D